ncbi:hypothetical protein G7B40_029310 [Aetokthonos hydrillicola Thurmond2011]|jgi:hypothetical protein|uniref:Uncharacterized protein n=2 Tax=Aetokthonos TaxID=1550243 RepID=A0AAP5IBN6_9CYAN|nr:hypothetical protein [Aetokthonos hydrillicola]MBW4587508.1 hypothetical protein [Aetokthonos hydrillicola CCALA 1050]MDR9898627.1 hypothetical protein [Aetokthonos hydrillicola Thurmond2011]
METPEPQLRKLKLEALQRDIVLGVEQLHKGKYSEYDDESLPSLLQIIQQRGQRKLNHE